jgi:SAM-dependent methyltransferase
MLDQYAARNKRLINFWLQSGFMNANSAVLDFGAGSGHILRSLKQLVPSIEISCIEADATASAFLRSQAFTVFDTLEQAPTGSFDAIILIELLEHVNDPVSLLVEIKQRLRPGGRIFATTPCGETRSGYRRTAAYDVPEHVEFWTEKSFQLLCEKTGLTFRPVPQRVMSPRKTLNRCAYETLRTMRDSVMGIRYLVGFLECAPANSRRTNV